MKAAALDVYACPSCHRSLRLEAAVHDGPEIVTGTIICTGCNRSYPVVGGVPRFVSSGQYAASFGRQWNWFRTAQLDSINGTDASARAFAQTTGWSPDDLTGALVLDAGVGAGRYADCASLQGAQVFGVDLTNAVDAAYRNIGARPNVHLAQADIFALPFRPDAFDRAYSIGVLHHTPNTERAFEQVAARVKPGGKLAVYLYARYGSWFRSSDVIRKLTTRLPWRVVLAGSAIAIPLGPIYRIPVLGSLCRVALPISPERHWRIRWLDTFDWYSPTYQWKHLYPEVFRWYRANGFEDVEIFDGPIRMCGRKRDSLRAHDSRQLAGMVAS